MAPERARRRHVGQHPESLVLDVLQVVDREQHRAVVEDRHDAVAGIAAGAVHRLALDGGDPAVPGHAELQLDLGLLAAAVGDEGLLAAQHQADRAARLAGEQGRDQLDMQRLGAAAEPAADMGLDHPYVGLLHAERPGQHEVDVVRHLGRGADGNLAPARVVLGLGGVRLALDLADLIELVGLLAHQVGGGETGPGVADLEIDLALDIAGALLVELDRVRAARVLGGEIGRQLLVLDFDRIERALRRRGVLGRDRRHRLAAIAHPVARERVFVHRDRQHPERVGAVRAGNHRVDAGQRLRRGNVDPRDPGVRDRAPQDPPGQLLPRDEVGGVERLARHLFRPVDQRHSHADRLHRRGRGSRCVAHAATSPPAISSAAARTASTILM